MGGCLIIGTAGHIDHGKSALITALTGAAMDRLAEEQRRGITIDLNFAPLQLADGTVAGVIDVPGHEDFVRTMVAGASGVDLALLVIAADEGVMPQTLEHLAVLEHLRVPAGIPVLTKSDLASPEQVQRLSSEVARRLSTSPVEFERPVAVSVRSGEGLGPLRTLIEALAGRSRHCDPDDLFRLPVDRAFSVPGVGTVVTGTAWSGSIAVGETVTLLPEQIQGKVRSVERHGRELSRSEPGTRTAIGISGVVRTAVSRGAVLVAADQPWPVTTAFDAEIALQSDAPRPLAARTRVRVLLGTSEVMARVLPRGTIEPGHSGLARLALEGSVVARGGDRFVIRSYSPIVTIGGGRVLDPLAPRRARWSEGLSDDDSARLHALLERRPGGIAPQMAPLLLGLSPRDSADLLRKQSDVRLAGDKWVLSSSVEAAGRDALARLEEYHTKHPGAAGMPLETLRRALRVSEAIALAAIDDLRSAHRIEVSGSVASLPDFRVAVKGGDAEVERIVRLLDEAGLSPPTVPELASQAGSGDLATVLRLAAERGLVKAVERDRYYSAKALDRFCGELAELGRVGAITPALVRDRLGVTRKYVIPLLEWADRQGITIRVPEGRRIVPAKVEGTGSRRARQ